MIKRAYVPFLSALEGQMILNHKDAIELLIASAAKIWFYRYTLLNLDTLLTDNLIEDAAAIFAVIGFLTLFKVNDGEVGQPLTSYRQRTWPCIESNFPMPFSWIAATIQPTMRLCGQTLTFLPSLMGAGNVLAAIRA